jgi:hypothetical protein
MGRHGAGWNSPAGTPRLTYMVVTLARRLGAEDSSTSRLSARAPSLNHQYPVSDMWNQRIRTGILCGLVINDNPHTATLGTRSELDIRALDQGSLGVPQGPIEAGKIALCIRRGRSLVFFIMMARGNLFRNALESSNLLGL